MKQIDVNNISNFLGKIRINKINDRETKIGLVNIHMELYKKVQEYSEYIKELQKKYFEGKEAELNIYNQQVSQLQDADPEKKAEIEAELSRVWTLLTKSLSLRQITTTDQELPRL